LPEYPDIVNSQKALFHAGNRVWAYPQFRDTPEEEITLEEKYMDVFKDQLRHFYKELYANKDKANAEFQRQINEVETKMNA